MMKKLFYDGSCKLCQREISALAPKLTPHLHYWQLAGYHKLVAVLRFAPCYWLASKAYRLWARSRANCADGNCAL